MEYAEKSIMDNKIKKILILRTDNLGDLILSLPAIWALKKEFPGAGLTLLVNKKNAALARALPYINKVIPVDSKTLALLRAWREIRKINFDIAIQLYTGNNIKEAILIFFSKARHRIGYSGGLSGLFFTNKIKLKLNRNETLNTIDIMKNLAPGLSFQGSGLEPAHLKSKRVNSLLEKYGVNNEEKIIVVHPGASQQNKNKMWPVQRYSALLEKITAISRNKLFIIGTHEEKVISEQINRPKDGIFDLTGLLDIPDLVNLIARSSLFIGNNSGPLQIAAALNVPSVSLMGPSIYERWAPQGDKHIVIQKKISCVPCEGKKNNCLDNICLKNISVDEVFDAVKSQLSKSLPEDKIE